MDNEKSVWYVYFVVYVVENWDGAGEALACFHPLISMIPILRITNNSTTFAHQNGARCKLQTPGSWELMSTYGIYKERQMTSIIIVLILKESLKT
jgi:hypothetical protein